MTTSKIDVHPQIILFLLTLTAIQQLMSNRICYQVFKPDMEFHMIDLIYVALPISALTEKTTLFLQRQLGQIFWDLKFFETEKLALIQSFLFWSKKFYGNKVNFGCVGLSALAAIHTQSHDVPKIAKNQDFYEQPNSSSCTINFLRISKYTYRKMELKRKYRKAEYVQRRVCFVNVQSSLHEKGCFFCLCTHVQCRVCYIYHVEFHFRLRVLESFPV